MDPAPITFEYNGKTYKGSFDPVAGAGSTQRWHLMIDNYYKGLLHCVNERWVFHGNDFEGMGDHFGDYIIAWYQ